MSDWDGPRSSLENWGARAGIGGAIVGGVALMVSLNDGAEESGRELGALNQTVITVEKRLERLEEIAASIGPAETPSAEDVAAALIRDHKEKLPGANSISIPAGAVMAFDRASGCPEGWGLFAEASGRFIIGVGGGYELPYVGGEPRYQTGGAETHALNIDEMPDHRHNFFSARWFRSFGGDVNALTDAVLDIGGVNRDGTPYKKDRNLPGQVSIEELPGTERYLEIYDAERTRFTDAKGAPHNNMPPYIALYFCKKEG